MSYDLSEILFRCRLRKYPILYILIFFSLVLPAQERKRIDILQADEMAVNEKIVADAQRLIGNVILKHNEVLMYCDSAYQYTGVNMVDAFGNVHVNQGDTLHLYAKRVRYNGDISIARAYIDVRLETQNATLYTDTLDYNLKTNVGYYDDNGKIVDSTNVLTSKEGQYLVDQDMAYFYFNVKGESEDYDLFCDSMSYNTKTSRIYIESPTTIRDSANILFARDGWYDTKSGYAYLLDKPVVYNDNQQLKATIIEYFRETGRGFARGAVDIYDLNNQTIVKGRYAEYDDNLNSALVTDSSVLIMYSGQDSLYLHADTLITVPDTIDDEKIVKAYWGVRFWRTDIQGACDSLNYFSRDSTVQLFFDPILWSDNRQLTSDYIEMKSNDKKPDEVRLLNNAFIISQLDTIMFDQIKGKNMCGYIRENELFRIDVDGNGQTLYYAQDQGELIGLNRALSSKIYIWFNEGKINRISLVSDPEGTLKPIPMVNGPDRRLMGFEWKIELRPLSRHDIFRQEKSR